mmetsp:Transcript_20735/g.58315  ORF Transcript_20735/g.58315 Transcript_20735/m.58315 type:complete len:233 (-) Transcript_20735:1697-2395(-)
MDASHSPTSTLMRCRHSLRSAMSRAERAFAASNPCTCSVRHCISARTLSRSPWRSRRVTCTASSCCDASERPSSMPGSRVSASCMRWCAEATASASDSRTSLCGSWKPPVTTPLRLTRSPSSEIVSIPYVRETSSHSFMVEHTTARPKICCTAGKAQSGQRTTSTSGLTPSICGKECSLARSWLRGVTTTAPSRFVRTSLTACAATSSSMASTLNKASPAKLSTAMRKEGAT